MNELHFELSNAERDFLAELLEKALKETRIEEHRTRTPSYRDHIIQEKEMLVALLEKLGKVAV